MVKQQGEIDCTASVTSPPERVTSRLDEVLRDAQREDPALRRFVQVRFSIDEVDPFRWVSEQAFTSKVAWQDRASGEIRVGVGVADEITGSFGDSPHDLGRLNSRLEHASAEARYYGGLRFDGSQEPADGWHGFGAFRFFLPRFEVARSRGKTHLLVNLNLAVDGSNRTKIIDEAASLVFSPAPLDGTIPLPLSRRDSPSKSQWMTALAPVLAALDGGRNELQKIVLARQVVFQFADPVDRYLLFKLLTEATPHCYHFLFQFDDSQAFIGATPERLYRRAGRRVESEAVAGTGLRDDAREYDDFLGNALLMSDKDQREHAFVRASILESFEELCSSLYIDNKASLMNLSMGRHLRSRFEGVLRENVTDVDILAHLPPTSAVGGYPRMQALGKIRELESFDRGWYAGTVGWMSKDAADFAVAIRSGLVAENRMTLFSGAGIVDGSDPSSEWAEIEQKIGDFINVLGLDQKRAKY